jgi:hypothetical protein
VLRPAANLARMHSVKLDAEFEAIQRASQGTVPPRIAPFPG